MVEIRAATVDDVDELSALFERGFGHSLTVEEWRWKYRALPGESRSAVAIVDGSVRAHGGLIALPAAEGADIAPLWQLVDWVGEAGSTGLRPPLATLGKSVLAELPRESDLPWCYGFPSARHLRLGERLFSYRLVRRIRPWIGSLSESGGRETEDVTIETGETFGDWAESIWRTCSGDGVVRSAEFLNWRYHARPDRYYRRYRLSAEDGEGFVVAAFVAAEAWLVELWLPSVRDWTPALCRIATDLRAAGLEGWRAWPRGDDRERTALLDRLGLEPAGEPFLLTCRGRTGTDEALVRRAAAVDYSMGDYDAA